MLTPESFAGDLLLVPARLMLPAGPVTNHAVVVRDGVFVAVGPADSVTAAHPELTPLVLPRILLMPGFVDVHHHLSQTFGKALAFGEPSEIFRRIWVPLEGSMDEHAVHLAAKLGALEALRGGFTTVADAGTRAAGNVAAIAAATEAAGLRCVLGCICNDRGGGGPDADADAILGAARAHLARFEHHDLVHPSLAISIPEVASDAMLRAVSALCAEAGAVFQTHVNEHLAAVERSLVSRGLRPIQLLEKLGVLGPQVLLAHATLLAPDELLALQASGAAIAYNPIASQWKGNAVAPAALMAAMGIRFGLGTDNTRADAFRLADAAEASARLAYGIAVGDSSCGAGWTWLDRATAGGADALGLGHRIGRIAPGTAADFLLIDLDVPEMIPSWDLTWELVRLANRDQILGVFVAGRLRLWRGWPPDWDARALLREVETVAEAAVAKAPIQRIHATAVEGQRARGA